MTAATQNTGTFMLSKEIEILMAERAKLLRVAGAAAQFVAVMESAQAPENGRDRGRDPRRERERAPRGHAQGRARRDHHAASTGGAP